MLNKSTFPVREEQVILSSGPTDWKAIIREDTNEAISVMSKDYKLI